MIRNLVLVLGDQLDRNSSAFDGFDPGRDAIWMTEAAEEARHVWSHKQRIALFLAAMRHFRQDQVLLGRVVHYTELGAAGNTSGLFTQLERFLNAQRPERVVCVRPGEHRVLMAVRQSCRQAATELVILEDRHFLSGPDHFAQHASGRRELRMEFFYREMRRRHQVLMEGDTKPAGGLWNYDADNRKALPKTGPVSHRAPLRFEPDIITREVLELVNRGFADHPGCLAGFGWAVTVDQARAALVDFIEHRLPLFGDYQDAMWTGEPFLFHSLISSSLNLKLIDPRDAIRLAEDAWRSGRAPLPAVEGFIRQILGWREYVRGVYWHFMPEYRERNALGASHPLPSFYWDAQTPLVCLREVLKQTLQQGYTPIIFSV